MLFGKLYPNSRFEWKGIDLNIDFAGGAMQGWYQDYELRNPYHGNGNSLPIMLFGKLYPNSRFFMRK